MLQVKFLDAPLIHPYNAPKYHASLIRAQQYAFRTGRILLWAAAEDQPCHPDHTCLSPEELDGKRAEWSMFHDQKTGGIMGLQPLAINMPLRITQTDQTEKTTLFKNRRCKLYGWKLHAVDLARLDACVEREMALEYLPEELLLKFEGVSWEWSKDLGPGIMAVKPKVVDWYLDRACKVRVRYKRLHRSVRLQRNRALLRCRFLASGYRRLPALGFEAGQASATRRIHVFVQSRQHGRHLCHTALRADFVFHGRFTRTCTPAQIPARRDRAEGPRNGVEEITTFHKKEKRHMA